MTNVSVIPHHILHTSISVQLSLLVAVPTTHASPALLPCWIWSDLCVEGLLRGEQRWYQWVPNPVSMADGVTPLVLKPEFISWHGSLHEAQQCHASDAYQKTTKTIVFFNCQLKLIPQHIAIPFAVHFLSLLFHIKSFIKKIFPQTFVKVCLIIFPVQTDYNWSD